MTEKIKNNKTELVFILDKSGSMSGLESDTIGGFNSMIEKQKKGDGEAFVTTVLFSDDKEIIHDRIPIAEVPKMTDREYFVGGCTALIDAVGDTIEQISTIHKYARPEDVPEHVMFVITTDGMENASHRFKAEDVRKMIEQKKEEGWEFLFLGANIDAVETAATYGISEDYAATYCCDSAGTELNYEALSDAITSVRSSAPLGKSWKKRIEEDFKNRG